MDYDCFNPCRYRVHQDLWFPGSLYLYCPGDSFILHFTPSEIVLPFAAALLVRGSLTFIVFVTDTTAGALTGSLILYFFFTRFGREAIIEYGNLFHIPEKDLDRSQAWFRKWGESAVFWGRLLPLVRALISIPAGIEKMDLKKYVIYSGAGALIFNKFTHLPDTPVRR